MAMNFTRSALLGQSPDMLSAQVEEANASYLNALHLIGRARGTTDPIQKIGYVNEAINVIEKADGIFTDDIKKHPMVAETIKKIQVFLPPELKQIQSYKDTQAQYAYMKAADTKAKFEAANVKQDVYPDMPPPVDAAGEVTPETKFPILPIAVAAGAIGLAFMIGS